MTIIEYVIFVIIEDKFTVVNSCTERRKNAVC